MMTRTPDEIKKGLECCKDTHCKVCPYFNIHRCAEENGIDALALIQQLEAQNAELLTKVKQLQAERDAAVKDLQTVCNMMNICCMCKDDDEGSERCEGCLMSSNWQWRGV